MAVACSLAGTVRAQGDACDLQAGPPSQEFEHYATKQWPKETERYKGDRATCRARRSGCG